MTRMGGNSQHRQVAVSIDFLQPLHYLETIHARHLKIEQDQVVAILAVKRADLARIRRGRDGNIAGTAQQPLEQKDTDLLIVDDKDFRVKNIR
jgi:hypothetical protein